MADFRLAIPHVLDEVEVMKRLRRLVTEIRSCNGDCIRSFQADWAQFGVVISFTLLGGFCQDSDIFMRVRVADRKVSVDGTMSGIAGVFSSRIKKWIYNKIQAEMSSEQNGAE